MNFLMELIIYITGENDDTLHRKLNFYFIARACFFEKYKISLYHYSLICEFSCLYRVLRNSSCYQKGS